MDFQTFVSDFMARQKRNESAATMKEQSSLLEASRQQDLDSRVVTTEQSTPEVKDADALTAEPFSLEDPEPAMDSAIPSIPLGEIGQLAEPVEALRGSVVSPVAAHQQASSPGLNIDAVSPSSDAGEAASAAILMSDEVLRVEPSETVNGAMPEAVPEVLLRDPGQPAAAQEQASSEQLAADATTIGQSIGFTATPTPTITPPGFDAPDVNEPHRSPVETAEPSSQQQYPQIGTTPADIHVSPQLQADINSRTDEISNPASATTATSDSAEGATTNEKIDATTHEVHAELPELFRSEGAVAAQHESAAGESADVSASERSVTDHAELSERTETQPHGVHVATPERRSTDAAKALNPAFFVTPDAQVIRRSTESGDESVVTRSFRSHEDAAVPTANVSSQTIVPTDLTEDFEQMIAYADSKQTQLPESTIVAPDGFVPDLPKMPDLSQLTGGSNEFITKVGRQLMEWERR